MKIPVSMGLRGKMMAFFCGTFVVMQLLAILILFAGIPGTSFRGEYRQEQVNVFNALGSVADLKKAEMEQWISVLQNDARQFAKSDLLRKSVAGILHSGGSGRPTVPVPNRYPSLKEMVGLYGSGNVTYRSIRIVDGKTGEIVFSTRPSEIGRNISGESGYHRVIAERVQDYIEIRKDPLTESVSVSISREILPPTETPNADPIAMLQTEVDPEEMAAFILHAGEGLGRSGEVVLVNQDQFVLTSLKKPLKDGSIARPLKTRITAAPAKYAAAGAEGIISAVDYAGIPVLAAYRHIRVSSDLAWGMVVKQDEEEVLAPLRRRVVLFLFLSMATVLLTVATSFFLARSFARPILLLNRAAAAVEAGDLSARAPEETRDELGALGRTFNNMVHRIQEWHEDLNREVEVRTAELTFANEELQKEIAERRKAEEARERASADLEEKNRDLEEIIYVTSHDLRSPLVNIIGFNREVRRSLADIRTVIDRISLTAVERKAIDAILRDDIDPALAFISSGTEKMDRLLAGLLRLSRTGRAKLEVAPIDMDVLLGNILGTFEFQTKERGVTVLREPLPPCYGDEVLISQVFSNLVDNALKYLDPTRPGIVRIKGTEADGHVVYCVEDNGIGIPAGHQKKILEIFYRLHPVDTPGEGLGLTIVRKILYRHDGRLSVESIEGKGSKFLVSLPKMMG